jgi:putative hydrolase of the HAD superfamily
MSRFRAIGFDLDNTLYDQGQHMRSFFRSAAAHVSGRANVGRSEVEEAFVRVWTVRTSYYPRLFDEALELVGLRDPDLIKALVSLYHQHRTVLTLFEGVREMLERLRQEVSLFLITDGQEQMQRSKIESLALGSSFDEVVVTGSFGKHWSKPAPHAFRHVLERFGGEPAEYLYVGDNPACDFYGAKQLGMRTARVLTQPFATHAPADEAYAPDITLANTIDLEQVLHDREATL